jgi:hypothetical protein
MTLNIGQRTSSATGGSISTISGYTVHTFTSGGNFVPTGSGTIEVLVVGGGGNSAGGGGGGGAVIYNKLANVTSGTPYLITVGANGSPTGSISSCTFNNATIIAYGGGSGGTPGGVPGTSSPNASGGGASGGVSGGSGGTGAGVTGLGFPGGSTATGGFYNPGGGGGASSVGLNGGPGIVGTGGIGISYSITGTSQYYGGGGGGGGAPNGGLTPASYGTGGTPGAVIIRYPT